MFPWNHTKKKNEKKNVWKTLMPPWCKIEKGRIYPINYPLSSGNHCTKFCNYRAMINKILSGQCWYEDQKFDLDIVTPKVIVIIFSLKSNSVASLVTIKQFDLDLSQCDLKINTGHPLSRGIQSVPLFVNCLGSRDIEQTRC